MSARCDETRPQDPELPCIRSEGAHAWHIDQDGRMWPNEAVARQQEMRVSGRRGALDLARDVAGRAERPTRAR